MSKFNDQHVWNNVSMKKNQQLCLRRETKVNKDFYLWIHVGPYIGNRCMKRCHGKIMLKSSNTSTNMNLLATLQIVELIQYYRQLQFFSPGPPAKTCPSQEVLGGNVNIFAGFPQFWTWGEDHCSSARSEICRTRCGATQEDPQITSSPFQFQSPILQKIYIKEFYIFLFWNS